MRFSHPRCPADAARDITALRRVTEGLAGLAALGLLLGACASGASTDDPAPRA